jgi:hypothetical protein
MPLVVVTGFPSSGKTRRCAVPVVFVTACVHEAGAACSTRDMLREVMR